jgi:hypothetical protein
MANSTSSHQIMLPKLPIMLSTWEISDGKPRYKCSKCSFHIKLETMQSYSLEFGTKDGFKIHMDNKDLWGSHYSTSNPQVQLYSCNLVRYVGTAWKLWVAWSSILKITARKNYLFFIRELLYQSEIQKFCGCATGEHGSGRRL